MEGSALDIGYNYILMETLKVSERSLGKAFSIPTPRLKGFLLFKNWLALPVKEKARSIFGTVRRIVKRKYYKLCTND
jgi:hypothetical protein